MTMTLLLTRVALWAFFIVPICTRLLLAGNAPAAVLCAVVLGVLASLVTPLDGDT